MKFRSAFLPFLGISLLASLASTPVYSQDLTPPYVVKPLKDITVPVGTANSQVTLKRTFGLTGVTGQVVRFSTVLGNIDVQMRADAAPQTVANFLNYVNKGAYTASLIHRSVPGFIVQGGGFVLTPEPKIATIVTDPPVVNEFKISNTRGTIAMAKLGTDPNSATDQWFFNEADANAANLDNQNGGFTVFGSVIEGDLKTVDALAAVPVPDPGPFVDQNSPLHQIPLLNYDAAAGLQISNLVLVNTVALVPLLAKTPGDPSILKIKVVNSNPALVTAVAQGSKLFLTYATGATGSAKISLKARDSAGGTVKTSFKVTVQ